MIMKIPRDNMNIKWALELKDINVYEANLHLLMESCWECKIEVVIILTNGVSLNANCSTRQPLLLGEATYKGNYVFQENVTVVYISHSDISLNTHMNIPLFNSETFSDVQIVLDNNEKIFAHKCILSSRNIVFEAMLKNNSFKEAQENTIKIVDFSADVINELIFFIYTGTAPKANTIAKDLLIAADKYQMPDLKRLCEIEMISSINKENAFDIIKFAVTWDSQSNFLYQRAICFMAHNHGK